jgi:hypothetical protein
LGRGNCWEGIIFSSENIIIDPGIDFGKSIYQNSKKIIVSERSDIQMLGERNSYTVFREWYAKWVSFDQNSQKI